MLCQCIFNDGGSFVEKYTCVHVFGQLNNSCALPRADYVIIFQDVN